MKQLPSAFTPVRIFIRVAIVAFLLAAFDPYKMLLFSPIILGAPHALSDIWYLLVKETDLQRRVRIVLAIVSSAILFSALLALAGIQIPGIVDSLLLITLLGLPLALSSSIRSPALLLPWAFVLLIAFLLLDSSFPLRALIAHLHNLVALLFLFALAQSRWQFRGVFLAGGVIAGLTCVGILVSILSGGVFLSGFNETEWSPFLSLAFGNIGGIAGAFLFSYAFLQLMHFAVWIGFIPGLKRDLSFATVSRALGFGIPFLGAIIFVALTSAGPIAAVVDPLQARQAYLTLVSFHGWMEISWLLAHSAFLVNAKRFSFQNLFLFENLQHA